MKFMEKCEGRLCHFDRETRIDHALLLYCDLLKKAGLAHGKFGVALYFYLRAGTGKDGVYAMTADMLLEDVMEELTLDMPVDFLYGITGIGWGVEFLIRQGMVSANRDEVLEELDEAVAKSMDNSKSDLLLFCSFLLYYQARLTDRRKDEDTVFRLSECWQRLMVRLKHELRGIPVVREDLQTFNFVVPEIWMMVAIRKMKGISVVCESWEIMEKVEFELAARIEKLLEIPNMHICNRIIFQWALHRYREYKIEEIVQALNTADLKTGMAGFILSAVILDEKYAKRFVNQIDDRMLDFCGSNTTPQAGYVFPETDDDEKFGLLSGLSGIGLAHYLVKNGTSGIL